MDNEVTHDSCNREAPIGSQQNSAGADGSDFVERQSHPETDVASNNAENLSGLEMENKFLFQR